MKYDYKEFLDKIKREKMSSYEVLTLLKKSTINSNKNRDNVTRYINHLDIDALRSLVPFILFDDCGKDSVLQCAEEFARMYNIDGEQE